MKENRKTFGKVEKSTKELAILSVACSYAFMCLLLTIVHFNSFKLYFSVPENTISTYLSEYRYDIISFIIFSFFFIVVFYAFFKCSLRNSVSNKVEVDFSKELVEKNLTLDLPKKVNLTHHCEFFITFDQSMDTFSFWCRFTKETCFDVVKRAYLLSYLNLMDKAEYEAVLNSYNDRIYIYRKFQADEDTTSKNFQNRAFLACITKEEFTTYCEIAEPKNS